MKCVCGYDQPEEHSEDVNVFFKSGPRKGELKCVETVVHEVNKKDLFVKIGVEKGFSFVRVDANKYYWNEDETPPVELLGCPRCGTIKFVEGW